jgi:HNH endonuclease
VIVPIVTGSVDYDLLDQLVRNLAAGCRSTSPEASPPEQPSQPAETGQAEATSQAADQVPKTGPPEATGQAVWNGPKGPSGPRPAYDPPETTSQQAWTGRPEDISHATGIESPRSNGQPEPAAVPGRRDTRAPGAMPGQQDPPARGTMPHRQDAPACGTVPGPQDMPGRMGHAAAREIVLRQAVALLSGPAGLASWLRRGRLTGPAATISLPLDTGAATEIVPPHLRRAVIVRDRHCAFAGCEQPPAACQVHHVIPRSQGGPTALTNLVLLCSFHHLTAVHRWGWTITLHADGTTTATSPDRSRVLGDHGPPRRAA